MEFGFFIVRKEIFVISIENVKKLNELELEIYNYVMSHQKEVISMKLKEIADVIHVSSSMITRVSQKLGYEGFVEWRTALKMSQDDDVKQKERTLHYIIDYFYKVDNHEFDEEIRKAVEMIVKSREVLFFGVGISSAIGKAGAFLFNRKGKRASGFEDFSMRTRGLYDEHDCAIVLTVSGETDEIIRRINDLKTMGVKVIVITNHASSSAAKMADHVLCYYVPSERNDDFYSSATQVPVIYIIETIAERLIEYGIK